MPRLADLVKAAEPDESEAEVEDEDVSILMYTSGTTSLPKGVMLRFRDFAAYVTANVEMADGTDRGVALVCVPFYHIAGTTAMMTNIWTGRRDGRHAAVRRQDLAATGRARESHPRLRRADHDEADPRRARRSPTPIFRSLTNLAYGGAAMPIQVIRRAIEAFPENRRLRQRIRPDRDHLVADRARSRRSSDRRHAGTDRAQAQAPQLDRPAAARRRNRGARRRRQVAGARRQVGEIFIRTPRIMKGYAGREDDAASARRMARDRRPRMGRRRRLRVLRRTQGRHDHPRRRKYRARRNRDRPDEPSGDRRGAPSSACRRSNGDRSSRPSSSSGRVRTSPRPSSSEFCRTRLASFKRPESIEFIDALPKNPLGKILRKELRAARGDDAKRR